MNKVNYGIDAPQVIRNLTIFGIIGFLVPLFFPFIKAGPVTFDTRGFYWMGIISDFRHMKEYQRNFVEAGLQTEFLPANYLTTFPPLPILKIKKV